MVLSSKIRLHCETSLLQESWAVLADAKDHYLLKQDPVLMLSSGVFASMLTMYLISAMHFAVFGFKLQLINLHFPKSICSI